MEKYELENVCWENFKNQNDMVTEKDTNIVTYYIRYLYSGNKLICNIFE